MGKTGSICRSLTLLVFFLANHALCFQNSILPGFKSAVLPNFRRSADLTMAAGDGGNVLITGVYKDKTSADKHVFNVLNKQGAWNKIGLFAEDSSIAKKKLLSRESRYSGLLDVLDFSDGDTTSVDAMKAALDGYDAWICFDCSPQELADKASVAIDADIKNFVVTSSFSLDDEESVSMATQVKEKLKDSSVSFTMIRTEGMDEGEEGKVYQVRNMTEQFNMTGYDLKIAKGDLMRIAAESLLVKSAQNGALAAIGGDEVALSYLKELREKGMSRREELEHILKTGEFRFWAKYKQQEKEMEDAQESESSQRLINFLAEKKKNEDVEDFLKEWNKVKEIFDKKVEERIKHMAEATWWTLYDKGEATVNRAVFRQKYGELYRPLATALQKRFDRAYRMNMLYLRFDVKSREEFEDKMGVVMDWDDEDYDKEMKEMDEEAMMKEIVISPLEGSKWKWTKVLDIDVVTPEVMKEFEESGKAEVPVKWLM